MIPPDTSMPIYDPPMSIWPGIITLVIGTLLFTYLILRIVREHKRTNAQFTAHATIPDANHDSTDDPAH